VPVISPFPFNENQPAKTWSLSSCRAADRVTPVRTGPLPTLERALARDQRRHADLDAGDVGDRVGRPGRAVEGDAEIAGARLALRVQARAGQRERRRKTRGRDER
jgi:hypothetical protein